MQGNLHRDHRPILEQMESILIAVSDDANEAV